VEWTRDKPNHIGFYQLQSDKIVCTLTQVSQPLPDGVDFEEETWHIKNNHDLFLAELSQTSSGQSFRLAPRFGFTQRIAFPLTACPRAEALADGRLGAEGSGAEACGSGDALKEGRAAAQLSALADGRLGAAGGSSGNSRGSGDQFALQDGRAQAQNYTTPPRHAAGVSPQSPGSATGASPSSSCGRSPMATPPSGAASPMATPPGGVEVKVDAHGVVRVGRPKRPLPFADMSHLQPTKRGREEPAKDCTAKDNSGQEIADKEVADADKEVADAEDNSGQEKADQEIADASEEVSAEDKSGQEIPDKEVADGASIDASIELALEDSLAAEEVIAEDNSGQEIPDEEVADDPSMERALEDGLNEDE
jgi:hypothetical protein